MDYGTAALRHEREVSGLLERAAVARALAETFAPPAPERRSALVAELRDLAGRCVGGAVGLGALADVWAGATDAALAAEHARLFHCESPCPPHQSAYGDARRMAGRAVELADISGFYHAFGVDLAATEAELPDHLATELEFYAILLLKWAYALADARREAAEVTARAAAAFMQDHLGRWPAAFAGALAEHDAHPAYLQAARVVAAWVADEAERLGVHPEPCCGRLCGDETDPDPMRCPFADHE